MLKSTAWSSQLARTLPENTGLLVREYQHFIKSDSRKNSSGQESGPAVMKKGKNGYFRAVTDS